MALFPSLSLSFQMYSLFTNFFPWFYHFFLLFPHTHTHTVSLSLLLSLSVPSLSLSLFLLLWIKWDLCGTKETLFGHGSYLFFKFSFFYLFPHSLSLSLCHSLSLCISFFLSSSSSLSLSLSLSFLLLQWIKWDLCGTTETLFGPGSYLFFKFFLLFILCLSVCLSFTQSLSLSLSFLLLLSIKWVNPIRSWNSSWNLLQILTVL